MDNIDETHFLIAIRNGDINARDQFLKANMPLVTSVAKHFNVPKEEYDDIFQIGCIGLLKAINTFSLDKGCKFSSYAVPSISNEIKEYLRDNTTLKMSRSVRKLIYDCKTLINLYALERKEITKRRLAIELNVSEEKIDLAMQAATFVRSLDEMVWEDVSFADTVASMNDNIEEDYIKREEAKENSEFVNYLLGRVNEKSAFIIKCLYGLCGESKKTQEQIAQILGCTQSNVSSEHIKALKKFKMLAIAKRKGTIKTDQKHKRQRFITKFFPNDNIEDIELAVCELSMMKQDIINSYYGLNNHNQELIDDISKRHNYAPATLRKNIIPDIREEIKRILSR